MQRRQAVALALAGLLTLIIDTRPLQPDGRTHGTIQFEQPQPAAG